MLLIGRAFTRRDVEMMLGASARWGRAPTKKKNNGPKRAHTPLPGYYLLKYLANTLGDISPDGGSCPP